MSAPSSAQEGEDRVAERGETPIASALLDRIQAALDAIPPSMPGEPSALASRRFKLENLVIALGWYPDNGIEVPERLEKVVIEAMEAIA